MAISPEQREKFKKMSVAEFQKEFDSADHYTQVVMAFILSLKKIFSSDVNEDIKADSMHSSVMFFKAACEAHAIERLINCHNDTEAPMELVVKLIMKRSAENEEAALERFRTMMELFGFKV